MKLSWEVVVVDSAIGFAMLAVFGWMAYTLISDGTTQLIGHALGTMGKAVVAMLLLHVVDRLTLRWRWQDTPELEWPDNVKRKVFP